MTYSRTTNISFLTHLIALVVVLPACSENDPSQAFNLLGELDAGDPETIDDVPSVTTPVETEKPTDLKSAYKGTMDAFIDAGYEVKISELDITIYSDYSGSGYNPEEEKEFTENMEMEQAERYRDVFELFRQKAAHITSVTLWGISDDHTWLDHYPVSGRDNHPLLFDDNHQPKAAYYAILDF